MNGDKAYILGFTTLAFGYFLGSLWSPDYIEFVSVGNNHLFFVAFGLIVFGMMSLIDFYYKKKQEDKK